MSVSAINYPMQSAYIPPQRDRRDIGQGLLNTLTANPDTAIPHLIADRGLPPSPQRDNLNQILDLQDAASDPLQQVAMLNANGNGKRLNLMG